MGEKGDLRHFEWLCCWSQAGLRVLITTTAGRRASQNTGPHTSKQLRDQKTTSGLSGNNRKPWLQCCLSFFCSIWMVGCKRENILLCTSLYDQCAIMWHVTKLRSSQRLDTHQIPIEHLWNVLGSGICVVSSTETSDTVACGVCVLCSLKKEKLSHENF